MKTGVVYGEWGGVGVLVEIKIGERVEKSLGNDMIVEGRRFGPFVGFYSSAGAAWCFFGLLFR